MDDDPDRWFLEVDVRPRPRRGPPGRRWQTGQGDRFLGAFLVDAAVQTFAYGTQNLKRRAAKAARSGGTLMARARRAPASPEIAAAPPEPPPVAVERTPSVAIAPPAVAPAPPVPKAQPEIAPAPLAAPAPSVGAPVTEAALASIVAVRQPIRPEFPAGGLVSIVPSLVITAMVVMLLVAAVSMVGRMVFGPYWSLVFRSTFSTPYSQPQPQLPAFPGYMQRR